MKDLKDMEMLGMEQLMEIADDKSVKVPENLVGDLKRAIDAEALMEEASMPDMPSVPRPAKTAVLFRRFVPYVAAAAIIITAFIAYPSHPKDTFDDPAVAYAELENIFNYMSSKTSQALDMARAGSDEAIELTKEKLDF